MARCPHGSQTTSDIYWIQITHSGSEGDSEYIFSVCGSIPNQLSEKRCRNGSSLIFF